MFLKQISYHDYRNIPNATIFPDPGVTVLMGDNAQGKTNALEGMFHFAAGKSFRGVRDRDIIRFDCMKATLEMKYADKRRENSMAMHFYRDKNKQMEKNGVPIRKTSEFVGHFHSVLFCPEHLMLIKGAPQLRRNFLNAAICQLKPTYVIAMAQYQKLLKQRNALLKAENIGKNKPLIEVLTAQMASVNTAIVFSRQKYLELLGEHVNSFLQKMTGGKETVTLSFECDSSGLESEDKNETTKQFYEKTMQNLARDLCAKTTLCGCHRDDIGITLNGMDAKKYASQGQDRSLALAMKLGEGEMSRMATGEFPVFLFDDVLSELDRERQNFLFRELNDRQVILTSCNEELFCGRDVSMIYVRNGHYQRERMED